MEWKADRKKMGQLQIGMGIKRVIDTEITYIDAESGWKSWRGGPDPRAKNEIFEYKALDTAPVIDRKPRLFIEVNIQIQLPDRRKSESGDQNLR